jgi:ATP-dependent protease HslVU (ClpYQ) peptidase subunit
MQIIQYALDIAVRTSEQGYEEYMVSSVAEGIRAALKDRGSAKIDNNKEQSESGFLVGYQGRLFKISSDYSVLEAQDGLEAIGCGGDYALGAMRALLDMSPKKRIRKALKIAAHFSMGVEGPFYVEALKWTNA